MLKEENTGREHRDDGNMKDGHTHTHGLCTLTHVPAHTDACTHSILN